MKKFILVIFSTLFISCNVNYWESQDKNFKVEIIGEGRINTGCVIDGHTTYDLSDQELPFIFYTFILDPDENSIYFDISCTDNVTINIYKYGRLVNSFYNQTEKFTLYSKI